MLRESKKITYHIEVDHKPGNFVNEMDHLTDNVVQAYERLQYLKEKYSGSKIKIERIIERKTYMPISESDLLEDKHYVESGLEV